MFRERRFENDRVIAHFRVLVCLCVKTSLRAKPFLLKCVSPTSSFSCKSNSFSYEKFCTKTRFDTGKPELGNGLLFALGSFVCSPVFQHSCNIQIKCWKTLPTRWENIFNYIFQTFSMFLQRIEQHYSCVENHYQWLIMHYQCNALIMHDNANFVQPHFPK